MDIRKVVSDWVKAKGDDEVLAIVNRKFGKDYTGAAVERWRKRLSWPPATVVQLAIDWWEKGHSEYEPVPDDKAHVRIMMPSYDGNMDVRVQRALWVLRFIHEKKLAFDAECITGIHRARNILATRWYRETQSPWGLFIDSDMLFPVGYPGETQKWGCTMPDQYFNTDLVTKLLASKKPLVGGLYFDRQGKNIPMYAEGRRDTKEREKARDCPLDIVQATDWVGTGVMLIHRTVFDTMAQVYPELTPKGPDDTYKFFNYINEEEDVGEDVSFCRRAKAAGIQPYVDLSCVCGHLGSLAYWGPQRKGKR